MIGLDTNVVVRYLMQDDPEQAETATRLIDALTDQDPAFVSVVTLAEIHWVLRRAYKVDREKAADVIQGLLAAEEILVEGPDVVRRALDAVSAGADFADALIYEACRVAGCSSVVTFDRRAAEAAGFDLLQ